MNSFTNIDLPMVHFLLLYHDITTLPRAERFAAQWRISCLFKDYFFCVIITYLLQLFWDLGPLKRHSTAIWDKILMLDVRMIIDGTDTNI